MNEIDKDIQCYQCDYNLRGLSPDGKCPECGTSISETFAFKKENREVSLVMAPVYYIIIGVISWFVFEEFFCCLTFFISPLMCLFVLIRYLTGENIRPRALILFLITMLLLILLSIFIMMGGYPIFTKRFDLP